MVNCAWLIFIRSSSRRLPGKCYKKIDEKTILEHICRNMVNNNICLSDIYLCTSDRQEDEKLENLGRSIGINVIKGDLERPVFRYFQNREVLEKYKYVSRVNGDIPFYESRIPLQALKSCAVNNISPDIISNILYRSFPSGMSIEIYSKKYLDDTLDKFKELQEIEHMSEIVIHASMHKDYVLEIVPKEPIPQKYMKKMTVDTQEDLLYLRDLYAKRNNSLILKYFSEIETSLELPGLKTETIPLDK